MPNVALIDVLNSLMPKSMRMPRPRSRPRALVLLLLLLVSAVLLSAAALGKESSKHEEVRRKLENGDPASALALLQKSLGKKKPSGEALLLASTARIMLGDTRQGETDLRQALALDPSLKQGWLNLAGVEIAAQRYDAAYTALSKVQELDPTDTANQLNLGAVRALSGRPDLAAGHFATFLQAQPGAQSHYLVAGNYALGGSESLAVEHLRQAIALDERVRLRVRSDNKFVLLEGQAYRDLLVTDSYVPPKGAHQAAAGFPAPYQRQDSELMAAVLEALGQLSEPFDPKIEATETWALIWGVMRIKITNQANGTGVVSMSAAAPLFTEDAWKRRTEDIFRSVHEILNRPRLRR